MIRESLKTGVSFGLTSGIITTLGLIVGLHSGTHSRPVILGGILTIAIADAFSDALGIHIAQESQDRHSPRAVWEATLATFLAKFLIALTFVLPVAFLHISTAIVVSVGWGLFLLALFNYYLARQQRLSPRPIILEHIAIALIVITITHFVGDYIAAGIAEHAP